MKLLYILIDNIDIKANKLFKANVLKGKGQIYILKCMWWLKKDIKTSSFLMGGW